MKFLFKVIANFNRDIRKVQYLLPVKKISYKSYIYDTNVANLYTSKTYNLY